MEKADLLLEKGIESITYYGPKVLGAFLIYFIGSWIIKKLLLSFDKIMSKAKYDLTLRRFLNNFLISIKIIINVYSV